MYEFVACQLVRIGRQLLQMLAGHHVGHLLMICTTNSRRGQSQSYPRSIFVGRAVLWCAVVVSGFAIARGVPAARALAVLGLMAGLASLWSP